MASHITFKQIFLALAGWTFALSATAQWQWIDKDGRKVFSDRPPTSDIKDKDILKQPGNRGRATVSAAFGETPEDAEGAPPVTSPVAKTNANAPKISGKDAELQAKKKKLDEEEAAKKKTQEEKVAQSLAENCSRARKGLAAFQSGTRMATVNAKGEREFMDDNTRVAESKRLQSIIESDCK